MSSSTDLHVTGHCQRCGGEHLIPLPDRGSHDLALDRVAAALRFCVGCGRYVGRSCCWRPGAVACLDCAEAASLRRSLPATESPMPAGPPGLHDVELAVHELHRLSELLAHGGREDADPREDIAWTETWSEAGLLNARIQSARDAVAKKIWDPPVATRFEAIETDRQVEALLRDRDLALTHIEGVLASQPRQHHAREAESRTPLDRVTVAGTILAVAVLTAGIVGVASGAWSRAILSVRSAPPVDRESPVSVASPSDSVATGSPLATASLSAAYGEWTFDDLRMGPIATQSDPAARGGGEVVAFPTAVDRSVRLSAGDEPLCLGQDAFAGSPGAASVDLHVRDAPARVGLGISLTTAPDQAHAVTIALDELGGTIRNTWITLGLTWSQAATVDLQAAPRDSGSLLAQASLTASDAPATDAAACLWRLGGSPGGEMLIDNVRIEN